MNLKTMQVEELVLQSLEHELGGVKVYEAAIACAQNGVLKGEWEDYIEETRTHVAALEKACGALGIDAGKETPGRQIVRGLGLALVEAMATAQKAGDPAAAELVACECVVLAETKDHLDWTLLTKVAAVMPGDAGVMLRELASTIEDQEDEHLYHTRGWCRELWIDSLGLPAMVPPLEEVRQVKTAMGAAHAETASEIERLKARARS
jgi:hypothetical protein